VPGQNDECAYQIYHIHGILVQKGLLSSEPISTEYLPAGIYVLKVENGESWRFVKM
jgi:hypothetical protein